MLIYLGSLAIGAALPLFQSTLARVLQQLAQQLKGLEADGIALAHDILSIEADIADALAELASVQGLGDSMLRQIAMGLLGIVQGIEDAIARILDGSALRALYLSVATAPAQVLAALEAALAEVTSKIARIFARINALEARLASILARLADIASRIEAILAMRVGLEAIQGILAAAGLHVYVWDGPVADFGGQLESELSSGAPGGTGGSEHANAIVLLTTIGATFTALGEVFRIA